ncbi:hypothetical protein RN2511_047880 [Rhodococcus sp. NKCM2511]|nr:hypothetical protein RN2511_047880 [Rhodococcus sp. NKCM2511]
MPISRAYNCTIQPKRALGPRPSSSGGNADDRGVVSALSIEVEANEARPLTVQFRFGGLATPATAEDFDQHAAAGVDRELIDEFATCRYLDTARRCCSLARPGSGKLHRPVGLA